MVACLRSAFVVEVKIVSVSAQARRHVSDHDGGSANLRADLSPRVSRIAVTLEISAVRDVPRIDDSESAALSSQICSAVASGAYGAALVAQLEAHGSTSTLLVTPDSVCVEGTIPLPISATDQESKQSTELSALPAVHVSSSPSLIVFLFTATVLAFLIVLMLRATQAAPAGDGKSSCIPAVPLERLN
jgi:hypothetical protein